jgi:Cdc6-like AAA superfamily ATPase
MVDYLDAIGAGLILLDPTPLGFDYLPAELVARDDLQRALAGRFSSIGHASGSGRAVITGPVGSGKTSLVRRFCDDVARHLIGTRDIAVAHIKWTNVIQTGASPVVSCCRAFAAWCPPAVAT